MSIHSSSIHEEKKKNKAKRKTKTPTTVAVNIFLFHLPISILKSFMISPSPLKFLTFLFLLKIFNISFSACRTYSYETPKASPVSRSVSGTPVSRPYLKEMRLMQNSLSRGSFLLFFMASKMIFLILSLSNSISSFLSS